LSSLRKTFSPSPAATGTAVTGVSMPETLPPRCGRGKAAWESAREIFVRAPVAAAICRDVRVDSTADVEVVDVAVR
jgi:hypothetical protein